MWWLISLDRLVLSAAGYDNGHECNWLLMCSPSDCDSNTCVPEVSFSAFQLEANWDFVTLYDGDTAAAAGVAGAAHKLRLGHSVAVVQGDEVPVGLELEF